MRSSRSASLHVSLRRSRDMSPMTKTSQAKTKKTRAIKAPTSGRNRASAEERLAELKRRLAEISDLEAAGSLLDWDQATYMPDGGARARPPGRDAAPALARAVGRPGAGPAPRRARALCRTAALRRRRGEPDPRRQTRLREGPQGAARLHRARQRAGLRLLRRLDAGAPANDFATMRPFLEKALDFSREYAGFFAPTSTSPIP